MEDSPRPLWLRILGWFLYGLLCVGALAGGAFFGFVKKGPLVYKVVVSKITKQEPPKVGDDDVFSGNREAVNLLLLGCDQDLYYRGKYVIMKQARADMILIARLDFKNNRITGISIPRDTLCQLAGYREQKINAYHVLGQRNGAGPEGGKELMKRAVESLVPVEIDRVLVLDYDAFQDMVDLVGGVKLKVEKQMDYDDEAAKLHIHFKPGTYQMDGYQAMGFVRFRKSNKGHRGGDSDFARQERQKQFLLAFKDAVWKNKAQIPAVAEKGKDAISRGLSDDEIIALAYFAQSVGEDNIKMGQVPVVDADNYNLRINQMELPKVLKEFHFVEEDPPARVSYRR